MSSNADTDALDRLFSAYPPTLTVDEVSEVLNISKQSAYVWLREGVIPGYKIGTSWRVVRDELKELIRSGANRPHTAEESKEE